MFDVACIILLIIEILLIAYFVMQKVRRKKVNETAIFIAVAYVINLLINLIPYLYERMILNQEGNILFEVIKSVITTPKAFVGLVDFDKASAFGEYLPVYPFVFLLGSLIAVLGTVSATVEAFSLQIINGFKQPVFMSKEKCDIVIGTSKDALLYAKNNKGTIILTNKILQKEQLLTHLSYGFTIWNKIFNLNLLKSHSFNKKTNYNLICFSEDGDCLKQLEIFISFSKLEIFKSKNIKLFLEVKGNQIETIRREIVEKNHLEKHITVFSRNELLARDFVENNPVTKYLPNVAFNEDASLKSSEKINCFFLGLTELSEEVLRQFIVNNQLVSFKKNEYQINPINYYLFDSKKQNDNYIIKDLLDDIEDLKKEEYVSSIEKPFNMVYSNELIRSKKVIKDIIKEVEKEDSFTFIIIDLDDPYKDVDLGARIRGLLSRYTNYHIFVCGEEKYNVNEDYLTYFGNFSKILSHKVIINEELSLMGKTMNKMYIKQNHKDKENNPDFNEFVEQTSNESWDNLNYFALYSNIYAALNLRVKLNLLGLDYIKDGLKNNLDLIDEAYNSSSYPKDYDSYFIQNKRNALLAQEHARWNAYHLVHEFMPLKKKFIYVDSKDENKVKFVTKNTLLRRHACLTSFYGLDELSKYLADKASKELNKEVKKETYDFYMYDESLILSAKDLLNELGYSIVKK